MENNRRRLPKIKTRPLTSTEKTLLVLLAIVLVIWVGNKFVIMKQQERIQALQVDRLEYETKIAEMNSVLRRENDIKAEWEQLTREKDEILSYYFPTLDQAQIIYLLNDMLPEEQVEIADYGFSRPDIENISEMEVANMGVSVPFSGNYDGIRDMIRAIELSPRRMMIDSLSLDRVDDSALNGNMNVKIYSVEGLAEADPNVIPIDVTDNPNIDTLFGSFPGFVADAPPGGSTDVPGDPDGEIEIPEPHGDILHSFEIRNYEFIPSHPLVVGSAVPSTISQHGRYGMRLEYRILGLDQENRAYVDISSQNIELRFPPSELYLSVYSFNYLPGNIGIKAIDQNGNDASMTISTGVPWIGWGKVSVPLPGDMTRYPLKITHVYYEVGRAQDDFGVLIFDKLEAFYSEHYGESVGDEYVPLQEFIFYEVQPGDTVSGISRKVYGTEKYASEILKNNEMKTGQILPVGKILALVKR